MTKTLYLCGAGNPEGVRLALVVNHVEKRWDRVVLLDDDLSKHGSLVLGVEIVGPFAALEDANWLLENLPKGSNGRLRQGLQQLKARIEADIERQE